MNEDFKRRIIHETMIFCGLLILIFFLTRLWPMIFLSVIILFICVIRLLFLRPPNAEPIETAPPTQAPRPDNEQDVLRRAFGLIQRRITEYLAGMYPDARWVWSRSNALSDIANGVSVFVLLNRAGGFRKAEVLLNLLQFKGLRFESIPQENPSEPETDSADDENEDVNYSLLAFEWFEAHSLELNQRCNETIAKGQTSFEIPAGELPVEKSWTDICAELIRNGFEGAEITGGGIKVNSPQ
jgi:hypothetical protein